MQHHNIYGYALKIGIFFFFFLPNKHSLLVSNSCVHLKWIEYSGRSQRGMKKEKQLEGCNNLTILLIKEITIHL